MFNIKLENGLMFPDLSNSQLTNDIFLQEKYFSTFLEQFINDFNQIEKDAVCVMKFDNVMSHFITIDLVTPKVEISRQLIHDVQNCNAKVIVLPLRLIFLKSKENYNLVSNKSPTQDIVTGHSNVLIIDKVMQTVEYYEPHGLVTNSNFTLMYDLNKIVANIFRIHFPSFAVYQLINAAQFCILGPQFWQNTINPTSGHCLAWSLYFIVLRILNNQIHSNILPVSTMINNTITLWSATVQDRSIRQFMTYVKQFVDNYAIKHKNHSESISYTIYPSEIQNTQARLIYLLDTYFTKQILGLSSDIYLIWEEINSYRHMPFFHNTFAKVFMQYNFQISSDV